MPVLPGAIESLTAPDKSFTVGQSPPSTEVFVQRWWTASGTVDQALDYLGKHTPEGLTVAAPTAISGPGYPKGRGIIYSAGSAAESIPMTVLVYQWDRGVVIWATISEAAFSPKGPGVLSGSPDGR